MNGIDFQPISIDIKPLIKKYFPQDVIETAVKVAQAESSGDPTAINVNKNKTKDSGLFQINDQHIPALKNAGIIYDPEDLFDPETNVKAAAHLYSKEGFNPWEASRGKWEGGNKIDFQPIDFQEETTKPTPIPPPKESFLKRATTGMLDELMGIPETIASLGTSAIAAPVSWLGSVGMTALKGGKEGKKFREYLSGPESPYVYQPQTEYGKKATNVVSTLLSPFGWPRKAGGAIGRQIDVVTGNQRQDWEEGLGNVFEAPLQALGIKGLMGGLESRGIISKTPEVVKVPTEKTIDQQIAKVVKEDFYKTVKPATGKRTTYAGLRSYGEKVGRAEKYIVENKADLSFVDDTTGQITTGKLPTSIMENVQAWKQSMGKIWQQADELVKAKTGTGITVSTIPFIRELKIVIAKNKTASPAIAREAQGLVERLQKQPNLTFNQIQEQLGQLNNRLGSKATSTYSEYGSMQVDSLYAKFLRDSLDKNIEGIKEIRNTYADFKAGEKDIIRAAARRMNIDPKKLDFLDIGAMATAAHAATTLQPGGLITAGVIKLANIFRQRQMNPDYNTTQMYKKIDAIVNKEKGFGEAFSGGLPKDTTPKKSIGYTPRMGMEDVSGQPSGYTPPFAKPTTKAIGFDRATTPINLTMLDESSVKSIKGIYNNPEFWAKNKDLTGLRLQIRNNQPIPLGQWNTLLQRIMENRMGSRINPSITLKEK